MRARLARRTFADPPANKPSVPASADVAPRSSIAVVLATFMMIGDDRSVAAAPEEARAEPVDHPFALAIGPSAERDVGSGPAQLGAEASFEADLIEHWLEVEAGVQGLVGADGHQLSVDVLVKKPFQLGRTLSMMVGVGPQVVRSMVRSDGGHVTRTDIGLEVAIDVMWWGLHGQGRPGLRGDLRSDVRSDAAVPGAHRRTNLRLVAECD